MTATTATALCLNRNSPLPQHLEAFKIASAASIPPRPVFVWILVAAFLGIVTSWIALLWVYYTHGAATAKISQWHIWRGGKFPAQWLMGLLQFPQPPDLGMWRGIGFGFGFALFCTLMRFRFLGWPLHPLGYALAVANPWTMGRFWLPFLLGWLAKLLTTRYGGLRAYRGALPFFLGLILGDYVMGAIWAIVGGILSVPVFSPFFERW